MNDIEKLDNVTWYGLCVIHVVAALNDLPDEAKLDFCQDLSKFIRRQQSVLAAAAAALVRSAARPASHRAKVG